ncbi:MAG: multicopper oxidase domain-containing protein [Vicinamibacterales bacterium]|nr:multicopper oxidase domain-containing protein [Vicinamibacterales bacterium]
MTGTVLHRSLLAALLLTAPATLPATQAPGTALAPIAANDNRVAAGELRGGVLTLSLEMRQGLWHPEREDGEAIPVYAFGEVGASLQVPGPLLRVPAGTVVALSVQNRLPVAATLHGLHQRPGRDADVIAVAPGATVRARFTAGAPGTYLYWARTSDGQRGNARVLDALLGGALVVDEPGAVPADRVFVLERWNGPTRTAINGKSWPYTERLTYPAGTQVHWRVVNASDLSHPMHLHGSHFTVDAVGDGERYEAFPASARPLVFTQNAEVAETFEMTWVPREAGRWLYHCHRLPHMRLPVPLDPADVLVPDAHAHAHDDPAYAGMGGMILGITVTGPQRERPEDAWRGARKLELTVGERKGDPKFFELSLRERGRTEPGAKPALSTGLTGPLIVLEQHQPVEIAVVNQLKESTAGHWHGIELESYYDGVPEWGGLGEKKTPAVEAGQTFVARMTPPRAGTFMYHTHWHDAAQLTGGVHGPLIVLPPGRRFDPETDRAFLFSQSPGDPFGPPLLLMNGVPQPAALRLRTGTTYRLRFMNITPAAANLRVSLRRAGAPVQWRAVAKDGVDLPAAAATMRPADLQVSVGETFDFEYEAAAPGEVTLEGLQPNDMRRVVQTLIFSAPRP